VKSDILLEYECLGECVTLVLREDCVDFKKDDTVTGHVHRDVLNYYVIDQGCTLPRSVARLEE
jgi:hypothetical protein